MPDFNEFSEPLTRTFSAELRSAVISAPLSPLDLGQIYPPLRPLLVGGIGDHLSGVAPSRQMEMLSGLWLVAGDCHQSHSISQDLSSPEGSFLHGIMHRREGDFGNAKYWFRRVGDHPVFEQIDQQTDGHYPSGVDFVDVCQAAASDHGDQDDVNQAMQSQWVEWQVLMTWIAES